MSTPRVTAGQIGALLKGRLVGPADIEVTGAASLQGAGQGDVAFAVAAFREDLRRTAASVVLVEPSLVDLSPCCTIVVEDPKLAFQRVQDVLYPPNDDDWGVHPTACIGRGTQWEGRLHLAPYARLGANVRLGKDCRIGTGTRIGDDCVLGSAVHIGPNVTIARAQLGHRVLVLDGARIGTQGFGFLESGGQRTSVHHRGRCIIGDDVEIGANSTIDRGTLDSTSIGSDTKVDNLVHVAHNVTVGNRCYILAQVGIAGSTRIEDDVVVAGQAGIAGHLTIGAGARIGAQAGVIGNVPKSQTVSGYPARNHRSVLRQTAALATLSQHIKPLESLAKQQDAC